MDWKTPEDPSSLRPQIPTLQPPKLAGCNCFMSNSSRQVCRTYVTDNILFENGPFFSSNAILTLRGISGDSGGGLTSESHCNTQLILQEEDGRHKEPGGAPSHRR